MKKEMRAVCSRCGQCCRADMISYVTGADRIRWQNENRADILDAIDNNERVWAGDRIVFSTGGRVRHCSFLRNADGLSSCAIYETRPGVCREFNPASSELCPLYINGRD